jgi:hypothetical protein
MFEKRKQDTIKHNSLIFRCVAVLGVNVATCGIIILTKKLRSNR